MRPSVFVLAVLALAGHLTTTYSIPVKNAAKKMVCYYGSWSTYRWGNGKFDVENIDPNICTHLIYTFAGLGSNNTIISLDPYNDLYEEWGKGAYERFTGLKKKNPGLKTLLAIGGWNEGSEKYSIMASDPAKRAVFVQSVVDFLIRFKFDGLDFDWEYPASRGGSEEDKRNFIAVSQDLSTALRPKGLMLTSAVACPKMTVETAYDVPSMTRIFDHIHLMCYDFFGAWNTFTGQNAPLYANPKIDTGDNFMNNVNYSVHHWISSGGAASKLILGMPLYGRGFTLNNAQDNGFYAPANQPIQAGPYTGEVGFWGYNEACEKFREPGWTTVFEDVYYQSPHAIKGNNWLGFDDQRSVIAKAKYANMMGLGGAMVWSIETDDFLGLCFGEPFILTKTIRQVIDGGSPTTLSPVSTTVTSTTPASTGSTVKPDGICKGEGYVADPNNCADFYQCIQNSDGSWTGVHEHCPPGTVFNPSISQCTFPDLVPGCNA